MRAVLALAALIFATSAAAQTQPSASVAPRSPVAPPPEAVAPAPTAPKSLPPPPARPQGLSGALSGGLSTPIPPLVGFKPLQGLSAVGDGAPQCRSACTKARATCGDDPECSDKWAQCVRSCAAPKS